MRKQYIIEVDESEIVEYWNEQAVKEIGYQEYALKQCPGIKVKPYNPQGDLISRSEVMKLIPKVIGGQNEFADCIRDSVKQVIDSAPTVEIPNYGGQVVPDILQDEVADDN